MPAQDPIGYAPGFQRSPWGTPYGQGLGTLPPDVQAASDVAKHGGNPTGGTTSTSTTKVSGGSSIAPYAAALGSPLGLLALQQLLGNNTLTQQGLKSIGNLLFPGTVDGGSGGVPTPIGTDAEGGAGGWTSPGQGGSGGEVGGGDGGAANWGTPVNMPPELATAPPEVQQAYEILFTNPDLTDWTQFVPGWGGSAIDVPQIDTTDMGSILDELANVYFG